MDFDLDLDALAPEVKKVKLGGNIIDVYPPRFKNLVALMKLVNQIREVGNDESKTLELIEALRSSLIPMIPALKDENVDLTIEQLQVLLEFVMQVSTPKDQAELESQGYSIGEISKKKEEAPNSSESQPTS